MNKKGKKSQKSIVKSTVVAPRKADLQKDMAVEWPELGNIGVVVGDVAVPAMTELDYDGQEISASKIKTGGIFVNIDEQQIWPIRYSSDTVNVQEYFPEFGFRKKR